jgi:hypothetical protein
VADLEERQALLAELRKANDERSRAMYEETGKAIGGLQNVYIVALLETLLGGPGAPAHVEACVLYEERRAESLDVNEPLARQVHDQEVAAATEVARNRVAGPRLVVPGRG